jgi:anti-sigma B factor antagonist
MHAYEQAVSDSNLQQPYWVPDSRVSDRHSGNVSIIDVDGPLTAERAARAFRERVRDLLDEGAKSFVVNLAEVERIDSYGLGALAAAYNWIAQAHGEMELFGPQPRVRRMLHRLRLDSVLPILDDEQQALQALGRLPFLARNRRE